jgi:hypothetical protein
VPFHGTASMTYRALLTCCLFSVTSAAESAAPNADCQVQHSQGQVLRKDGRLLEAQQAFHACAEARCPEPLQDDCFVLHEEVTNAIPSVLLMARRNGEDLPEVRVFIDGQRDPLAITGRPLPLDPGGHHFRFIAPGQGVVDVRATLIEREKNRVIAADFGSPTETAEPTHPGAYVFGGLGILSLGSFAAFSLSGRHQEFELIECAPNCSERKVERMRRLYLYGDISLGVSLLSFGVATYLLLESRAGTPQRVDPKSTLHVGLRTNGEAIGLAALGSF